MATEYLREKQKLKSIRYMLLGIAAVNALAMIIFGIISSFLENSIPAYFQALIIEIIAYIIPIMIYVRTNNVISSATTRRFNLCKCSAPMLVISAIMGICFQFAAVVLNLPFNIIFNTAESYSAATATELIAAILILGLIPAVFEEFLFRGMINGTMSEFNSNAAVIFSSLMFAVLHTDICGFIGYLAMGFVCSSVASRTGSLYAAMLFHFTNNVTALLLGYFNASLVYEPTLTILLFTFGTLGFIAVFALFLRYTKQPVTAAKVRTSVLLGQSFVNIPILLCAVIVVASILLQRVL